MYKQYCGCSSILIDTREHDVDLLYGNQGEVKKMVTANVCLQRGW